ncbi:MAG TPA: bifunctional riboflavin kinase/FAD synthetase, partial [Bacteroidota bacterium]
MKVYRGRTIPRNANSVVTVGVFDGLHLAHQRIIEVTKDRARDQGVRSVVVIFDPHPKEIVLPSKGPVSLLTTIEERLSLLEQTGIDAVCVLPFTYEFSRQSAQEFYKQYIIGTVGVSVVVVGYDHMFGRDREGGVEHLKSIGEQNGFRVVTVQPVAVGGEVVSSTRIRQAIADGNVEKAAVFLGRPYEVAGRVEEGKGRGKQMGFPTANIRPTSTKKLIPRNGVYFVQAEFSGKEYFGMMNIGVRPTFEENGQRVIEVHLLDFDGQLYGAELRTKFLGWVREERKFSSERELVSQLQTDREECLRRKERNYIRA